MEFEWAPDKERSNVGKHGQDFAEAMTVFNDPFELTVPDPDHSIGDGRFVSVGESEAGRLLVVSCTERTRGGIRIICAGRRHERNDGSMNGKPEGDALRPEYDFSGGVRGKHYRAYRRGTTIVPSETGAETARGTNEDALREALHTIEEHREDAGDGR